ncbi:hypothetical protein IL306_003869, partial [Fusarium sp. DS 682]
LIALFGERVTMQFMSQATGWADSFILAMAPLGILTIIVSAIRVGGPSWLKAIIGRARENLAAAEVELMSSTSEDVCELWNGSEIVRSLGSPPVREFIFLLPKPRAKTDNNTELFEFECKTIEEAEKDGHLTTSQGSRDSEKGMGVFASKESIEEIRLEDLHGSAPDPETKPKIIIIYNESVSAPNISLNVHPQKRAEVRIAAVLGTLIQLGVLMYAGFATYYHTMRFPKEENKPVSNYAFPCTASGTIVLVTGLLLCADVVEKRTAEVARKPRTGYDAYAIWVQRQATIGDQVFRSFGIFSTTSRKKIITSRRDDPSKKPAEVSLVDRVVEVICYLPLQSLELFKRIFGKKTSSSPKSSVQSSKTTLGAFLSISGYVVQFVGLRGMHWSVSIVQLGAVVFMTAARAAIRRGLANPPQAQSLLQDFELEWLACTVADTDGSRWDVPEPNSPGSKDWIILGGECDQFEPLGETKDNTDGHSRPSNEQNRDESQEDIVKDHKDESEEESEDNSDDDSEDDSQEESGGDSKKESGDESEESVYDGEYNSGSVSESEIRIYREVNSEVNSESETSDKHHSGSVTESKDEDHTNPINSKAHTVMVLRSHFAKVTGWRSPIFAEANSLSRAIEVVMNTLFLKGQREQFNWPLRASYNNSEAQIVNVSLSLVNGNWKISRHDVEAILSFWILSMRKNRRDGHAPNKIIHITAEGPGVQLLGADTPQLRRDLRWWVPPDLKRAIIVRESPTGSLVVEKSLVVGCGRASKSPVKLERIQLDEDDNNPPYGQTVNNGFLAVESFVPPASLYALDLFSSFMRVAARTMDEPIHGEGEVRPNEAGSAGSWTSFTLHNRLLSKMAGEVQSTGLATLSEVYSAIIPPLSIENKLPVADSIIELAREHARPHEERGDMKKVTEVYIWLIKTARLFPQDTQLVFKATAVLLDHLSQLILSTHLSERLKPIAPPPPGRGRQRFERPQGIPLQEQIENELQLDKTESRNLFIRLMSIYKAQDRLHVFPSRLIQIAKRNPAFPQLRRSVIDNPLSEDEEATGKGDITGWAQLHWYAARKYDQPLAALLENDIDLDAPDLLGQTALHAACHVGATKIASLLARNGADINARARDGSTPLHIAARKGYMSTVRLLVESGAQVDMMNSARMTPAMWAAFKGQKDVLSYLWKISNMDLRDTGGRAMLHLAVLPRSLGVISVFEKGIDTEVRDHGGRTPLHLAVLRGNFDALGALESKLQADMDALDNTGKHLVHLAAVSGHMKVVKQLINAFNADVNCRDDRGETPLHLVVRECKGVSIKALVKLKANLEARNHDGETSLMMACQVGNIEAVKQLLSLGADRDTMTNIYGTPILYEAAVNGHRRVVRYLLNKGIDKECRDKAGETPLHGAARNGNKRIVELLLNAGAEKERRNEDGETPLHHAATWGSSAAAQVLVLAGADKNATDNTGMTPLHHAALYTVRNYVGGAKLDKFGRITDMTGDIAILGHERIVRFLLEAGADRQIVDKFGRTAQRVAEQGSDEEPSKQRVVEIFDTIQAK